MPIFMVDAVPVSLILANWTIEPTGLNSSQIGLYVRFGVGDE
jgi:hypothetical protein